MSKGFFNPFFPSTQKDVSRLRQSATDAATDLSSTASTHANKVGGQLHDLADHFRTEGERSFHRAKNKLVDVATVARNFAAERPLACIGAALVIGIFIGASRTRHAARKPKSD